MPRLKKHSTSEWTKASKKWHRENTGANAIDISREERRRCSSARAAFFTAKFAEIPLDFPASPIPCQLCGEPTSAWCEGCYLRCKNDNGPFAAICTICDAEKLVCPPCVMRSIDYNAGHRAYLQTLPGGVEQENVMNITGYSGQHGEHSEFFTQVQMTASQTSADTDTNAQGVHRA